MSALNDKSAYPALLTMPQSPFSPVFSLINLEKSLIPLLALHWFCCITNVQCPKSISCTRLQIYVCVDLAVSFQSSSLVTSNWITYHRENIYKIYQRSKSFQNAKHSYKVLKMFPKCTCNLGFPNCRSSSAPSPFLKYLENIWKWNKQHLKSQWCFF